MNLSCKVLMPLLEAHPTLHLKRGLDFHLISLLPGDRSVPQRTKTILLNFRVFKGPSDSKNNHPPVQFDLFPSLPLSSHLDS